jgi:hypothetical protein
MMLKTFVSIVYSAWHEIWESDEGTNRPDRAVTKRKLMGSSPGRRETRRCQGVGKGTRRGCVEDSLGLEIEVVCKRCVVRRV